MKSSPYLSNPKKRTTKEIMWWVVLLLTPTIITMWVFYGIGILLNISIAILFATTIEYSYLAFINKSKKASKSALDGSIVISAILFALCLPPFTKIWIILLACFFIVIFAKQIYGGIGYNIFNPAMVGYVFVLISFPAYVTIWPEPYLEQKSSLALTQFFFFLFSNSSLINLDSLTSATPLSIANLGLNQSMGSEINQTIWFIINFVTLIAGVILLRLKIISWHLPISFLTTFFLINLIFIFLGGLKFDFIVMHFFSGATMLAAFFIITDPVSAATSNKARIAQGILFAILLFSIRSLGSAYPDGVGFAILFCNLINPLLDKIFRPRRYGY